MSKSILTIVLAMCFISTAVGQNDRYSLYYFANAAINPAKINQNNRIEASGVFRSQQATKGSDLTTAFLDLSYPFFYGKKRWSSLGLSFSSDRSGLGGIFQTDEGYLNYAVTVVLARPNIISLGTSIRYVNSRVNTEQLVTGSQFQEGLGFNPELPTGEPFNSFQTSYLSTSFGAHWKVIDKTRTEKSALGVAVSDVNRPNASFMDPAQLPVTVTAEGSYRFRYSKKVTYYAEVLHSHSKARRSSIMGIRADVNLYRFNPQLKGQNLQLFTKYRLNEGLALGAIWDTDNLSFGTSYDIPIGDNVSHLGAFEIAVKYSKIRRPKRRRRRNRRNIPRVPRQAGTDPIESLIEYPNDTDDPKEDIDVASENENPAYDLDIEKPILLHFRFEFGSAEPVIKERGVIDEIARILKNDLGKSILIIGHTDNVGSKSVNRELSFERAESIYELLVELGVDDFQMTLDGKGEDEPISTNKTEEGRALNRRVEIKFIVN